MEAVLGEEQHRRLAELVSVYPVANELGERFSRAGYELYLVGGSVRDTLLHGRAKDLDFATSARPSDCAKLLRGWADHVWTTGARFGTISAAKGDWKVEVTTLRSDAYTPGSRHPEVSFGDDITTDLSRRDFTVNAMAVRVPDPWFYDPHGGLADLQARRLRTPLAAEVSFGDDPLRMVRMARFAAVLDAEPDASARQAATAMAERLDTVSRERIRDELNRLIVAPHVRRGMDLLCETGLAERFLPEIPALRMQRDPYHRHKDVYVHTLAVVAGCPADDLILRLAALLHDIGKPATRQFHPGGKVTFHHHEVVGERIARARLKELRYPNDQVDAVCSLVFLHLRFHGYGGGNWTDSAVRRYARDAGHPEQLRRLNLLTRADVTTQNERKANHLARAMDDLEARIERLEAEEELARIRPPLDGHEIMAYLGLEPGPLVGRAREMLLEARLDEGPMDQAEARRRLDEWATREGIRRH